MDNYTMSLDTAMVMIKKLCNMGVQTVSDAMVTLQTQLRAENVTAAAAKDILVNAQPTINNLIKIFETIDAMKGFMIKFEPTPCGIIVVAQTHSVAPGDRVEFSFM
jgi:hypothetical protein